MRRPHYTARPAKSPRTLPEFAAALSFRLRMPAHQSGEVWTVGPFTLTPTENAPTRDFSITVATQHFYSTITRQRALILATTLRRLREAETEPLT
jgi:hypothetical protein